MKLTKTEWDKQYVEGKWNYLLSLSESGRNALIASYCRHFFANPVVLDVGCGFGNLSSYLNFDQYLGIDFSPEVIQKAKERVRERERERVKT